MKDVFVCFFFVCKGSMDMHLFVCVDGKDDDDERKWGDESSGSVNEEGLHPQTHSLINSLFISTTILLSLSTTLTAIAALFSFSNLFQQQQPPPQHTTATLD